MSGSDKELSLRGRLILGGVLFLVGAGLLLLIGRLLYVGLAPYFWEEVDCRVLEAAVHIPEASDRDLYEFRVLYSYRYHGEDHVSTTVSPWYSGSSDYADVQRLIRRYPEGGVGRCRVDPGDPARSALIPNTDWQPFLLLVFPPLLILPGGLLLVRAWEDLSGRSLTLGGTGMGRLGARVGGLAFFGLFFLSGAIYGTWSFLGPLRQCVRAQGWEEIPCTVVSSRYRLSGDSDGSDSEYAPDILYSYRYGGIDYRSSDYDFHGVTSGDLSFIRGILARYPAGATAVCYVDPGRPERAVLDRGMHWASSLPSLLFAAAFVGTGIWGFRKVLWPRRR